MRRKLPAPGAIAFIASLVIAYGMIDKAFSGQSSNDWQKEYKAGAELVDRLVNIDLYVDETKNNDFRSKVANNPQEADAHLRKALEEAREADADDASIAKIIYKLAIALMWQERRDEAKNLFLAAKGIYEKIHPGKSVEATDCMYYLASIVQSLPNGAQCAEDQFITVYENYMALLPKDDARFGMVLPVIGAYTKDQQEAAEYYGQYVEVQEKRFGKNSPKTVLALELYGAALANNYQHAQAAKAYEQAIAIRKANPGKNLGSNSEEQMNTERKKASGELKDEFESGPPVIGKRKQRQLNNGSSQNPVSPELELSSMKEKYGLFDNKSMDEALQLAEKLSDTDMPKARAEWTRVIQFMHDPRWFPSAALLPISLRFARLANKCLSQKEVSDADQLMRAAIEFPFHKETDEREIDTVGKRLLKYYDSNKQSAQSESFIGFAVTHLERQRANQYQKLRAPEMLDD